MRNWDIQFIPFLPFVQQFDNHFAIPPIVSLSAVRFQMQVDILPLL